jgi:hypothetical protein
MRSVSPCGSRSRHVIDTSIGSPAARGRSTTSVVGSGRATGSARPPERTAPTVSLAPWRARYGSFAQSRNTIRPVARSGAKWTASVPAALRNPFAIRTVSA